MSLHRYHYRQRACRLYRGSGIPQAGSGNTHPDHFCGSWWVLLQADAVECPGHGQNACLHTERLAEKMAEQLKMTIRPHSRVTAIEPSGKERDATNGEKLTYSQLILALGADPIRCHWKARRRKIFSVNDLDDYHRLRNMLEGKKEVDDSGCRPDRLRIRQRSGCGRLPCTRHRYQRPASGRLLPGAWRGLSCSAGWKLRCTFHLGAAPRAWSEFMKACA